MQGQAPDGGFDLEHGHSGYCPEHYYYTLKEFIDRFRPSLSWLGSTPTISARTPTCCAVAGRLGRGEALARPDCAELPSEGGPLRDRTGPL